MEIPIIHFLFLLGLTISQGAAQSFNLPTASSQPYTIGGTRVMFSDLSLGDDLTKLKCTIHIEGTDAIPVEPVTLADHKTVSCRLPLRVSSGKVSVDLEYENDQNVTDTLSKSIFLVPEPRPEVLVDEDWDNSKIEFQWDPNFFKNHYPPASPILLESTILVSEEGTPIFVETGIRLPVGLNDMGTANPNIPDSILRQIAELRYPYFYVVRAAAKPDVFQTSNLLTPTLGKEPDTAKEMCNIWLLNATGPAHEQEITPCPNCLCKAKLDPNFVPAEYDPQILKLAEGRLANHQLYKERVPTQSGHAQTCSYNLATTALATSSPVQAGWHHYVSKDVNYVENYISDIWPYIVCCLQTNSIEYCEAFHQKRPVDTGHKYPGPDDPCQGTGDPHMITFDGVRYDFMGYGEFWLIHGPASEVGAFGVQGRMSPLTPDQKVTYFRAVAVRDGGTTVQIQHDAQGALQIIVNRKTLLAVPQTPTPIPLGGISLSVNGDMIELRLQSGFTIKLQNYPSMRVLNVFGSGLLKNKGKGFKGIFGNFDGDITNDLTNRHGLVIEPTAENIRNLSLLHNVFGLTWMTTHLESYFTYEDGLGWENYTNVNFGPILEYPDPATMPDEVRAICKENLACYYEYVGTGSLKDAEDTVVADEDLEKLKEENNEKILMCDVIPPPPNGKVAVEGYMNGSVATYSCGDEYDIEGEATRTCAIIEDGEAAWDGQEPVCLWTCVRCTEAVEYELTRDPNDCSKFFACTFGIRYALVCPEGELFNPEFGVCDKTYVCPGDPPGC